MAEHGAVNSVVVGSNPTRPAWLLKVILNAHTTTAKGVDGVGNVKDVLVLN